MSAICNVQLVFSTTVCEKTHVLLDHLLSWDFRATWRTKVLLLLRRVDKYSGPRTDPEKMQMHLINARCILRSFSLERSKWCGTELNASFMHMCKQKRYRAKKSRKKSTALHANYGKIFAENHQSKQLHDSFLKLSYILVYQKNFAVGMCTGCAVVWPYHTRICLEHTPPLHIPIASFSPHLYFQRVSRLLVSVRTHVGVTFAKKGWG